MPTAEELFDGSDAHLLPTNEPAMQPACGVVALLVGKDGRVIANVTDFNAGGYGGFSLKESQTIRAKRNLAISMMRELSSPLICSAIETHDAEKIMTAVCSRSGCRLEIVVVGHEA